MNTATSAKGQTDQGPESDQGSNPSQREREVLTAIADELVDEANGDKITIGNLLDAIDSRGFGPLILVPAVISASPVGAIPGMSLVTGAMIFLVAAQMLFRSGHPWLPKKLQVFEFSSDRFKSGMKKVRPWVSWIDALTKERWTIMVVGPMHYVLAIIMMCLSVTYYPLALIPGGVFLPGAANSLFAIGITTRDGLLITIGLLVSTAAVSTMCLA